MRYALSLGQDNRILSVTYERYATASMVIVNDIPSGNVSDYRYVNSQYVYDPLPEPTPITPEDPVGDLQAVVDYNIMMGKLEDPSDA